MLVRTPPAFTLIARREGMATGLPVRIQHQIRAASAWAKSGVLYSLTNWWAYNVWSECDIPKEDLSILPVDDI